MLYNDSDKKKSKHIGREIFKKTLMGIVCKKSLAIVIELFRLQSNGSILLPRLHLPPRDPRHHRIYQTMYRQELRTKQFQHNRT